MKLTYNEKQNIGFRIMTLYETYSIKWYKNEKYYIRIYTNEYKELIKYIDEKKYMYEITKKEGAEISFNIKKYSSELIELNNIKYNLNPFEYVLDMLIYEIYNNYIEIYWKEKIEKDIVVQKEIEDKVLEYLDIRKYS